MRGGWAEGEGEGTAVLLMGGRFSAAVAGKGRELESMVSGKRV